MKIICLSFTVFWLLVWRTVAIFRFALYYLWQLAQEPIQQSINIGFQFPLNGSTHVSPGKCSWVNVEHLKLRPGSVIIKYSVKNSVRKLSVKTLICRSWGDLRGLSTAAVHQIWTRICCVRSLFFSFWLVYINISNTLWLPTANPGIILNQTWLRFATKSIFKSLVKLKQSDFRTWRAGKHMSKTLVVFCWINKNLLLVTCYG